jgi:hypothetical protein
MGAVSRHLMIAAAVIVTATVGCGSSSGGRGATAGSQTQDVVGVGMDGTAVGAGLLPFPLSDATAIPVGDGILVVGGLTPNGLASDVLELTPGAVR